MIRYNYSYQTCELLNKKDYGVKMIETERLILRPFIETDADDAFEYLENPMVNWFACMKVDSIEEAKLAVAERSKDKEFYYTWFIKKIFK